MIPDEIPRSATGSHWRRGAKDYGWPDPFVLLVEVWWPLALPAEGDLWP